jgi:chromosomal replication initiation ATPase DnaA
MTRHFVIAQSALHDQGSRRLTGQLVFDLNPTPRLEATDFFVAACNEQAARFVGAWPNWDSHAAVIFGPPCSGKTHLASIWRERSGASLAEASEIGDADATGSLVVEDADRGGFDETALFHRLNLAGEHGCFVLLTAREPPGQWPVRLPDLRSRIRSFPAIEIMPPDEELLATVLLKHFSDRQLTITPDIIPFLLSRMERSMAAARALAAHLDKLALSERRKVTRAFAAKAMKQLQTEQDIGCSGDQSE